MRKAFTTFLAGFFCLSVAAQNVGIGTGAPAQKLDVVGNIKVSGAIMPGGDAGTAGSVLTSNGAGVAPTWESAAYTGAGRFWITPFNNARSTGTVSGRGGWNLDGAAAETSQEDSLDFLSSNESGSDFTISNPGLMNNYITLNRAGLYHFEGSLRYFVTANINVTMLPRATLFLLANQPSSSDLSLLILEDPLDKTGGTETGNGTNAYNYTAKFSINIHLQAGTTVAFKTGLNLLRYPGAVDIIAMGVSSGGYLTGHFIAE